MFYDPRSKQSNGGVAGYQRDRPLRAFSSFCRRIEEQFVPRFALFSSQPLANRGTTFPRFAFFSSQMADEL